MKRLKSPDSFALESERLHHLELVILSALDRMESRLLILENRVGEELTLPLRDKFQKLD